MMKQLQIVILDDNQQDIKLLESLVSGFDIEIKGRFDNAEKFLQVQKQLKFDVLFLDVELNNSSIDGIVLAGLVHRPVIFITGLGSKYHEQLSDRSLDKNIVCTVSKPLNVEKLKKAIEKTVAFLARHRDYFFIKTEKGEEKLEFKRIVRIRTAKDARDKEVLLANPKETTLIKNKNFFEILQMLPTNTFLQINKHTVLNMDFIKVRLSHDIILLTEMGDNQKNIEETIGNEFSAYFENYLKG